MTVAAVVLIAWTYLSANLSGHYVVVVYTDRFGEDDAEVLGLVTAVPGMAKELWQDLRDIYGGEW